MFVFKNEADLMEQLRKDREQERKWAKDSKKTKKEQEFNKGKACGIDNALAYLVDFFKQHGPHPMLEPVKLEIRTNVGDQVGSRKEGVFGGPSVPFCKESGMPIPHQPPITDPDGFYYIGFQRPGGVLTYARQDRNGTWCFTSLPQFVKLFPNRQAAMDVVAENFEGEVLDYLTVFDATFTL